ncbi:hypothetical protein [Arcticibacterium luteifluviistationis]|uniref:Fibronectin type-III domain-containing protein n=1 Tax=Arcticibacterium luteifluviistationis TaxID=1784714 RepID=A0A2Z4GGF4_9BACT|nr:hypothetical protein [Arcticibacterium luteifluviistationis]AWW00480.1 hypothetical protein DJ013_20775 [Arcticibacterium luteifluviistationis]
MKKILFLLLISTCSFAQVTISGASEAYLNVTYNPLSYSSSLDYYGCIAPTPPSSPYELYDAGTSIYTATISIPGYSSNTEAFIIRRNAQWNIEARDIYGSYIVFYRSVGTNSDPEPPCDTTWEKWDSWCFSYGDIDPTGIYTSSIHLTGNCVSCETLSGIILPEIIDFPIISDFTMNSLTPADGLRKGSTAFNCALNSLVVYDGCKWEKVKTESMYKPSLITAGMQGSASNQQVNFTWFHPKPSIVSQFVLQYSMNNGPWTDYQSFNNATFAYVNNSLPTNTFDHNQTYNWRVKSIETCGINTYSCLKGIYFPFYNNYGNSYPALINIDAPFTVGSAILIKMVSNSSGTGTTSWQYDLEYYNGTSWQNVLNDNLVIASFPHNFVIPGSSLLLDGKYRVSVKNPTYGGAGFHYVTFYYAKAKEICPD